MRLVRKRCGPALVVALLACTTNVSETGTGLPENRGTEIQTGAAVDRFTELAWSADGSQIYFQSRAADGARLHVVPLAGGTPRLLDGPRDSYVDITPAPDGTWLFFAADLRSGVRTSYRLDLTSGPAQVLAERVPGRIAITRSDGSLILPAPNGATIAFIVAPDSIFTMTVATGQRTFITRGCERLVAHSPDLRRVLCVTAPGGAGAYMFVDLQTSALTIADLLPPSEGVPQMIHWDANGIAIAYQTPVGLALWNTQRNQGELLFTFPRPGMVLDPRTSVWSRDGRRLAFWVHECLRRRGLSQCDEGQSLLFVVDLGALRAGVVAVARGREGGQAMALTPNGARIGYVFDGRIYYQPTAIP